MGKRAPKTIKEREREKASEKGERRGVGEGEKGVGKKGEGARKK
jgi:hypothetical protein